MNDSGSFGPAAAALHSDLERFCLLPQITDTYGEENRAMAVI